MNPRQNHNSITPIKISYIIPKDITRIEYTIVEGKMCVTKYFEFDGKYLGTKDEYSVAEFLKFKLQNKAWINEFEIERIK